MNVEEIHEFALALPDVTEGFPFGPDTLVMKNTEKIFLFISLDSVPLRISMKGDPEENISLREEFSEQVLPGYHLNKQHWNTLIIDGKLENKMIKQLIVQSHRLVSKKKK